MEDFILIEDAILCLPGWLAAIGKFLGKNWQTILSVGANVASTIGSIFSNKKANEANAAEAEKSRNWQERMYNLYESPSAQMIQRKRAGLNVLDGISSQSVGSGASAPSAIPTDFSSLANLPLMFQQLKSAKLQNTNLELANESAKLDNQMKALEAGNKEAWIKLELETMQHNRDYAKYSAEEKRALADKAWQDATQFQEFHDKGGNIYDDAHSETLARIDKLRADESLTKEQTAMAKHLYNLAKKYDDKFKSLELQVTQQEVQEFLDQSDNRAEFYQLSHELFVETSNLTKDQIKNVIGPMTAYDAIIANDILTQATDDDKGRFDAVLLKWFTQDPSALFSAISHLVPNISYKGPTTNVRNIVRN